MLLTANLQKLLPSLLLLPANLAELPREGQPRPGEQPAAYNRAMHSEKRAFFPLAISLHLMKGFISPYKPCLTTTLNPC